MTETAREIADGTLDDAKAYSSAVMHGLFGPYWEHIHIVYGGIKDDGFALRVRDAFSREIASILADHESALLATERRGIERAAEDKDEAYHERNQCVAALARLFPSGIARTDIPGWLPEWHGCVYIDLPTGQVSWHYHDREAHLFADLPAYDKPWDGHDTSEKYRRLAILALAPEGDGWLPTHRHVKRGTEYVLIGIGKMQSDKWIEPERAEGYFTSIDMREVAIYRGHDGSLWVRPREEFEDGRFEPLPSPPKATETA